MLKRVKFQGLFPRKCKHFFFFVSPEKNIIISHVKKMMTSCEVLSYVFFTCLERVYNGLHAGV